MGGGGLNGEGARTVWNQGGRVGVGGRGGYAGSGHCPGALANGTLCGVNCVYDLDSDVYNCGGCGITCPGVESYCQIGQCYCTIGDDPYLALCWP